MAITIPTVDQILSDLQIRFQNFFGVEDFNISPDTPNGQIVRIWTHALYQSYQVLQYGYGASRYNQATGDDLDNLLSLIGIIRRVGSVSFNAVSLTGVAGETVPAGSLAATSSSSAGNFLFYLSEDVELDENGKGTGIFIQDLNQNITTNRFGAGDLTKVVTILKNASGNQIWTGVFNPTPSQNNPTNETDGALRARSSLFISRFSSGYLSTIRAAVLTTPGARNVQVFENVGTSTGIPIGLPLHNILVIGHWAPAPTSGSALAKEIATQIGEVMPPTTAWNGGTTIGSARFSETVTLPTGQSLTIGFATAKQQKFGLWVYLEQTDNLTEATDRILTYLWEFFDNPDASSSSPRSVDGSLTRGRPIGSFLSYQDMQCAIRELGSDGLFSVENIWISNNWNGTATTPNTTSWVTSDLETTTFDNVLLFENEADPNTGSAPSGQIKSPQLTIAFQSANGV